MKTRYCVFVGAALLASGLCVAQENPDSAAKIRLVPPYPALRAVATSNGIPINGIDPLSPDSTLAANDSVTALIMLYEKGREPAQWLLYFQAGAGTKDGKARHADPAPTAIYTSTGNKFEFTRSPATIRVRTLGPFLNSASKCKCEDKTEDVSVNKDFLGIGFDSGALAAFRWSHCDRKIDADEFMRAFRYSYSKPFPSARTNHDAKLAAALRVTPSEERAVIGWMPAMSSYFETVEQTSNLEDLLAKVVVKPSAWSVVRNLGVRTSIDFNYRHTGPFSAIGWGLPPGFSVYSLAAALHINERPALDLTMITAPPRPPFLTCGGIIGLLAQNPADAENYLTLRVISAHRGLASQAAK